MNRRIKIKLNETLFGQLNDPESNENNNENKRKSEKDGENKKERKRRYKRGDQENDNTTNNNTRNNDFDDPFEDSFEMSPLFSIILGAGGGGNLNSIKNKSKSKQEEEDDFNKYFEEASELHPIDREIKTLRDLIELGETYDPNDPKRYVINMRALHRCLNGLKDLQNMIGMTLVKDMILDLIFFRLQNIKDKDKDELWHTVIQGSPGTGKTEISKILGKIFYGLGICKEDKFTAVKRSDLIGKYCGHTAKMTQDIFDNAKGGILFIDEAYALGNPEQKDTFSKECIDTINQNLTENKDTIVFIAGYKEQLDESFFSIIRD